MKELRFDGKTAIVTGAGGNPSLGRAHAMLLAARGANVVVNDIGGTHAPGPGTAEGVVREIKDLGGKAVADTHSIATWDGASAMVKTALDAFGSVDILVNNAGICINAAVDEISPQDFQKVIDVNVLGVFFGSKAAWPHMRKKGYGRIINITSMSFTGFALQSAYSTSKGAVFSMTRSMAAEGEPLGIKVNSVAPGAFTRMVMGSQEEDCPTYKGTKAHFPAELVSPAVAFLAHESCPVTGECIDAMGGGLRRIYVGITQGFSDRALTIEKVAENWSKVVDGAVGTVIPAGSVDSTQWHSKPYKPAAKTGT
jgi:NAD(P)-dependent dehydrogenase (short-subunit alcohol dehydrogenase family)